MRATFHSIVVVLLVALVACGGDGDGADAGPETDASTDTSGADVSTPDTADEDTGADVGPEPTPDAGPPDVSSDTADPDVETDPDVPSPQPLAITPGVGIGPIEVGMTLADVVAAIGEPAAPIGFQRLFQLRYNELGLEIVMTSPANSELVEGSRVIAVGTWGANGTYAGAVTPGDSIEDARAALAEGADELEGYFFDPTGFSVEHDESVVTRVGVFPTYTFAPNPPEMQPASTTMEAP